MKADDPAVEHELRLAEAEVERLTQLLNSLLTLARGGDRPVVRGPVSLRSRVGGGARALAAARRGDRAHARARRRRRRAGAGRGGGRGDRARQPDRERPRLLAARDDRDDLVEPGRTRSPSSTRARASRRAKSSRSSSASAAGAADRPGTGLGLAIVETLARRWGGTASIRNRETGGARAEVGCPSTARPATWSRSLMRTAAPRTARPRARRRRRLGVHLITRETISLPVVRLEQPARSLRRRRRRTARRRPTRPRRNRRRTTTEDAGRRPTTTARAAAVGQGLRRQRGPRAVVATTTEA